MSNTPRQAERPPFVRFEDKEHGRNEEASKASGRHVPRVLTMIFVTQHGSKDEHSDVADDFIAKKRASAIMGNYNPDWVAQFQAKLDAYRKGMELPPDGTPVQTWSAINKEQQVRLKAIGYLVIEDLAQVPDSGLSQIGLDGRHLRDLARAWIAEGSDRGVNARELADAKTLISDQAGQIDDLRQRLIAMETRLADEGTAAPPRARRTQAAATA